MNNHTCNAPLGVSVSSFESFKTMCIKRTSNGSPPYECKKCETGELIKSGKLVELPSNVPLIVPVPETNNSDPWNPISKNLTKEIDLNILKNYWKLPLVITKQRGVCPNCKQTKVASAMGLCGACYTAGKNLKGPELLKALRKIAAKLQRTQIETMQSALTEKKMNGTRFLIRLGNDLTFENGVLDCTIIDNNLVVLASRGFEILRISND